MGQEESPLAHTKEILSLKYELKTESNAGSVLSAQLLQPTPPPLTPISLSPLSPPLYTMS